MKNQRCLFCKEPSHDSKSVEHIIPESIGSRRAVLPKGIVCDKCNNYFSRKVEHPVLSHQSFRNIRAWYQVPNKKGKYPTLKGRIAEVDIEISLKKDKDGNISINPENESRRDEFNEIIKQEQQGKEFLPRLFIIDIDPPQVEMSRFLAKMALESFAFRFLNYGHNTDSLVDEPHFDLIRNFARLGNNVDYWPYHRRFVFPMETNMRHPETNDWVQAGFGHDLLYTPTGETYFIFLIYGIEFCINLGGPAIKGYEIWLEDNKNICPLIERTGAKLVSTIVNGKTQYFIEGKMNMAQGAKFDMDRNISLKSFLQNKQPKE